jgi:hypothetical protein
VDANGEFDRLLIVQEAASRPLQVSAAVDPPPVSDVRSSAVCAVGVAPTSEKGTRSICHLSHFRPNGPARH